MRNYTDGPNFTFLRAVFFRIGKGIGMLEGYRSGGNFCLETRKPRNFRYGASYKIWHRPTLPHVTAVPSALAGLTSLFGMGRGGHRRYRHLNILIKVEGLIEVYSIRL